MKKILLSLLLVAATASVVVMATSAYFSDTETSVGNTFTAGTIDISVNDQNPWSESFTMEDMKPCYTDYINFRINNDNSDPNPVNIFKKITNIVESTGTVSEPECTEQGGYWDTTAKACDWDGYGILQEDNNDLSSVIWYDLNIEVYDGADQKIWWQTLYLDSDHKSIDDVYGAESVFLGMIPAGGYMLVEQSYHLAPTVTNWAQGDSMTFSIEVEAEQLYGKAWLENKEGPDTWKLVLGDDIKGTLTYKVKHPTFDFTFTGKAPLASHDYYLIAGENTGPTPGTWDPNTYLGDSTTDSNGNITITGDVDLGKDMKDAKVWLVPTGNWNGSNVTWGGWPGCVSNFLWETGLIWYEDTDL